MGKKLALRLAVEEDDELRSYVKDLVRGQVQVIVREEIRFLIREVADKTTKLTHNEIVIAMNQELNQAIKKQTFGPVGHTCVDSYAREYVREKLTESMKEMDISSMIKSALNNREVKVIL